MSTFSAAAAAAADAKFSAGVAAGFIFTGAGGGESRLSLFWSGSVIEEVLASEDVDGRRENRSRSRVISPGNSKPSKALLMLFREKMLPKLPATTRGNFFARIAVAACSLELPQPIL